MAACAERAEAHSHTPLADHGFTTGEGLRALLDRLHDAGAGAWQGDADVDALMAFTIDRYAPLTARYGADPGDAAAAAFEAMRNPSTRGARDPWAVVTTAVRCTLAAEHRANGLLVSTARARRAGYDEGHDVRRMGEDLHRLPDHHPSLVVPGPDDTDDVARVGDVSRALADSILLLIALGWPPRMAGAGVEFVCSRLADIGNRPAAYECLRRDKAIRARLDLPHHSWIGLLRVLLGHPSGTGLLRHGLLARLLAGDDAHDALADEDLVGLITRSAPRHSTGEASS